MIPVVCRSVNKSGLVETDVMVVFQSMLCNCRFIKIFNRDSELYISKAWDPAISAFRRLLARGHYSTSAPVLAMLVIDHSVPDTGNAHSDWTAAGKLSDQ